MMVLVASLTTVTLAQTEKGTRRTAEQRADMATKRLTEKLALTAQQATNIHEVILKREKLRDEGKLTKEDRQKIVGDINKYLNKEQQDKWEAMRKEAKEHGRSFAYWYVARKHDGEVQGFDGERAADLDQG